MSRIGRTSPVSRRSGLAPVRGIRHEDDMPNAISNRFPLTNSRAGRYFEDWRISIFAVFQFIAKHDCNSFEEGASDRFRG
jgi:hypothetical protein